MTVLEQEIIEKFKRLTPERRARVLSTLHDETTTEQMSLAEWLERVEAVRFHLRNDVGEQPPSSADFVNDVREERDADLLRSVGFGRSSRNRPN